MSSRCGDGGGGGDRGGGGGPHLWRNGNGIENVIGGHERLTLTGASAAPQNPRERERERDRDKNHETVCNMLSMLTIEMDQQPQQTADHHRMLLLNMTNSPESCMALRRAGCIPLLIEILHPPQISSIEGIQPPEMIRLRAARALKNIVQFNPDEKVKRKELSVLKLLEGIRSFSEAVRVAVAIRKISIEDAQIEKNEAEVEDTDQDSTTQGSSSCNKKKLTCADQDKHQQQQPQHPTRNITTLMKLSFDEEHRNTMCLLGAIHAIADLILSDHLIHGNNNPELKEDCLLLRRYSGMTLTNLTFGDGTNKALLCGMRDFMVVLVSQLDCENEDVCQVTASVLRNLSWRADSASRAALRDSDAVPRLTLAAIKSTKESTLKATLSALWNLSAHSTINKSAICTASPKSLPFLISLLRPNSPALKSLKTPLTIIENAGGILRNISSQISGKPELRKSLREHHCYEILLEHLKSGSLTVVSNACGTLWNLSAGIGCEEDQRKLIDLNAMPMLKSLIYSKHERISQGASAAFRNLLSSTFAKDHTIHIDTRIAAQMYSPNGHGSSSSDRGGYISGSTQRHEQLIQSPGSEPDYDFEFSHPSPLPQPSLHQHQQQQHPHHLMQMQDPPFAHQQSFPGAVSLFSHPQQHHHLHQHHTSNHPHQLQLHFHHPPAIPSAHHFNHPHPHPPSAPSGFHHRPTSINYSIDSEPLDLTLTSAKSSPIHVISAAEFGSISQNQRKLKSSRGNSVNNYQQHQHHLQLHPQQQQQHPPFLNHPNMLHHPAVGGTSSSQNSNSIRKYYGKFNHSCPEILSRFQNNMTPAHMQSQQNFVEKPLDFSSTSVNTSAASSTRGGADMAPIISGIQNDSGPGDTTFNYSLKFTEVDDEIDVEVFTEEQSEGSRGSGGATAVKSEDTLKTYCYEGTPNFSISNSCQDLVQELEMETKAASAAAASQSNGNGSSSSVNIGGGGGGSINKPSPAVKLQPIDEMPKQYYVENTPAVFSRTSSLSSINSSGLNGGENRAEYAAAGEVFGHQNFVQPSPEHQKQDEHKLGIIQLPQHQRKRTSQQLQQAAVTIPSADLTPLMFSRCSSVASLDSLDVAGMGSGGAGNCLASSHNDEDLSDFSRRASEVVSPSDLPDSPRAMAPPVRIYEQTKLDAEAQNDQKTQGIQRKLDNEDTIKVFSMEEKSGLNSCRSLSPLTIDGEILPVARVKMDATSSPLNISQPYANSENKTELGHDPENLNLPMTSMPAPVPPPKPLPRSDHARRNNNNTENTRKPEDDELKVFAMEGTPFYGVSNATSLSDLTIDMEAVSLTIGAETETKDDHAEQIKKHSVVVSSENKISPALEEKEEITSTNAAVEDEEPLVERQEPNVSANNVEEEDDPIYSDVQLLQKCIRAGRAAGIPKSKSEFRISSSEKCGAGERKNSLNKNSMMTTSLQEGNSQQHHKTLPNLQQQQQQESIRFDDPDLAALIMKGRNKKEKVGKSKEKTSRSKLNIAVALPEVVKSKVVSPVVKIENEKSVSPKPIVSPKPKAVEDFGQVKKNEETKDAEKPVQIEKPSPKPRRSIGTIETTVIVSKQETVVVVVAEPELDQNLNSETKNSESLAQVATVELEVEDIPSFPATPVKLQQDPMDPSQISTTSLGSEWNDETPTFSSPIPSMSISTAFKLVAGNDSTSPLPGTKPANNIMGLSTSTFGTGVFSCSTISMQNELLENMDPPSCFSNLVSSTDCVINAQAAAMKQSTVSERMNKKWKNLNDPACTSTHSNLSGQKPPPDFDLENSMISVASIKSEIFELSSSATNPDFYQSALEDIALERVQDTSLGGNTYTIFPPDNVANTASSTNGGNEKSVELVSEGNTIVSEDFTDAEDIEEFETAPVEDFDDDLGAEEKQAKDAEENEAKKLAESDSTLDEDYKDAMACEQRSRGSDKSEKESPDTDTVPLETEIDEIDDSGLALQQQHPKPLMEVHPLDSVARYNTYVIKKTSPLSPRSSPRQKRREDPERYRTHTIKPVNSTSLFNTDPNGNPSSEMKFATFRVGGPKVVKPCSTIVARESESNSPESTPGNSPKGIRGRRKLLYSSLPPGSIVRKKVAPPPVPPKPSRNISPARSTGACATGMGVYVRPTRTSELRIAANSRDNSPGRGGSSKNSSNSSLNLIHRTIEPVLNSALISTPIRPKIAPKPPTRTTAVTSSPSTTKPFAGSTSNVQQMKASNSSFGFGMAQRNDGGSNNSNANMKGYNTLPKSSKLGMGNFSEAKENGSGNGIEKGMSKIGKITNLWRKMEFHKSSKDNSALSSGATTPTQSHGDKIPELSAPDPPPRKVSSKFSNFFGRKKEKVVAVAANVMPTGNSAASGGGGGSSSNNGVWVRRDGENKTLGLVAPFNYVPPVKEGGFTTGIGGNKESSPSPSSTTSSTTGSNGGGAAAAGSAKITTV